MLIIPAIDIIGGKVVRLEKGDFNKEKVYSDDPVQIARKWEEKGAKLLHIVDLDGAREGKMKNQDMIIKVIKNIKTPCEAGGGIRDKSDIEYFLNSGARRVVLGTRAFEDPRYLEELISEFREKIAVGVDFSGNKVVKKGWQETTGLSPMFIVQEMQKMGVKTIVVTDISVDGTLKGPKIGRLKQILNTVNISVIASGGISSLEDIKKLREIKNKNLEGVIIGKALYEGKIDLKEAIEIAEPRGSCSSFDSEQTQYHKGTGHARKNAETDV
ncbi:MAG: 1-(5-phosphoribosyl)-5-[(5-phosphoribosylamino)methylideneamino]imidazole-4-carboxamide isomerase [Candidatus Omnitrophica bacterium CG1_02_40_15]|nr:MAG: 1-(5-phosphoribosyl)-5-[(5-phosphoribosylamino)methylideneamino]imidazole-4-carboxamide isomerase [Candidatus Omnitrophica bacterium CG1_02_40_15]